MIIFILCCQIIFGPVLILWVIWLWFYKVGAIELEFTRKKRFHSVRGLISTQWYQELSVKQELVEVGF